VDVLLVVDFEPRVLAACVHGDAVFRVFCKHLAHQIFCLLRDSLPISRVKHQFLLQDVLEDFLVIVAFEGWVAAQENK